MLEAFAQIRANAYNMPAKELKPPFSVHDGVRTVYPGGMTCMVSRACEAFRSHENAFMFCFVLFFNKKEKVNRVHPE